MPKAKRKVRFVPSNKNGPTPPSENKHGKRHATSGYRVVCRAGDCLFNVAANDDGHVNDVAAAHRSTTGHRRVDV